MTASASRTLCPYRLPLSGAVNFRDLGGYRIADGRRVRRGLVFRSDHLSRLTVEDQQMLRRLRFKVVCDLRTVQEQQRHPDQLPQDAVLLLDSSRIAVLPLAGRSFHFKPLASAGDYECGELIGEYTLELKNEAAHGMIRNLTTS